MGYSQVKLENMENNNKIKKTYTAHIGGEDVIIELMKACKFTEISRVATGGLHSSESVMITFEGDSSDFDDNFFIEKPSNGDFKYYYSLRVQEGLHVREFEKFKELHDLRGETSKLTVKHF